MLRSVTLFGTLLAAALAGDAAAPYPPPGYPKDIRRVTVDLNAPPESRWYSTIVDTIQTYGFDTSLGRVVEYWDRTIPKDLRPVVDEVAALLAPHLKDEYLAEMRGIFSAVQHLGYADQLSFDTLVTLNLFYSLTTGCTSIVSQDLQGEMWHSRNMDWSFAGESLYNMTAFVDFQRGGVTSYTTLTWLGFVGGLTGMRPNSFSVTIDQRESGPLLDVLLNIKRVLDQDIQPVVFLARDVLATEGITYSQAVQTLATRNIAAPVYYIVCGTQPEEGAVITRDWNGTDPHGVLSLPHGPAPWYVLETNYDFWRKPPAGDNRRAIGEQAMAAMGQANVNADNLFKVMQTRGNATTRGTFNSETVYTVVINPKQNLFRGLAWQ